MILFFLSFGFPAEVALAAEPMGAMAQYQMGITAERAGNMEGAIKYYEEAVRIGGDIRAAVGALVRIAHIQMTRRDMAEAERAIAAALQRDPSNPDALLMQARLWLMQDKPRRAAKNFEELSSREPLAVPALLGIVESALIRSDPAAIRQAQGRLMARIGDSIDRMRAAQQAREDAEFFAAAQKDNVALFLAELAFSLDSTPSSKEFLAMIRYQVNQIDSAAELFRELLSDPESSETARTMLAQIEVQRKEIEFGSKRARFRDLQSAARRAELEGKLPDAIKGYEEVVSFGRGMFAVEVGEAERKLAMIRKRYAEDVERETKSQAFEAMRSGRFREAADMLRQARTVVGPNMVMDGMLAEALLESADAGRVSASDREAAYREILDIDNSLKSVQAALPSAILAQAHAQLGLLLESQKRWNEAVEHYEAARERSAAMPNLSGRLFVARIRASLFRASLVLLAVMAGIGAVFYRWPNFHRTLAASLQYEFFLRRGDRDRQYHALTALVALRPHRTDLRRALARMADEKGDEEVSLYLHEQLRRESGLEKDMMLKLFDIYERRNDTAKAYDLIGDLLKENIGDDARAKFLETKFRMDLDAGRTEAAYRSGRELFTFRPTAWVAEMLVKLMLSRGVDADLRPILKFFRTWFRLQPGSADRIVSEAESLLARASTPEGTDQDPSVREMAQFVVDILLRTENQKRAAQILETLRVSEKNPAPTLQMLLKIYASIGDAESVFRTTQILHETQPSNFDAAMNFANLLRKRNDTAAAESVFLNILPHHPNNVELVKTIMEAAQTHFDASESTEFAGRVSASASGVGRAPSAGVSDAGRVSASGAPSAGVSDAGRLDRAIEMLRTIVAHTFLDTRETRLLLARSLIKKGRADEAIAILQAIEGGGYPRIRAQSLTAEAFIRKDQPGLAADILSKVNFDDPNMTEDLRKQMWYLQAEALEAQGLVEDAAEILDKLILLDIKYRDVKDRHDRLAGVKRRTAAVQGSCPSCGKSNPAESRYCASCGSALQPS